MPTYSSIEIEFLVDLKKGSELKILIDDNGTVVTKEWFWVVSRSSAQEVTTGTPTFTAGERTAINFEAAFDLDEPSGYVTTQTTNTILIQSETLNENFVGLKIIDDNSVKLVDGVDYNVTFDIYTPPFDISTVETMRVRSPHYVTTPFFSETTTKVTLSVYVWTGLVTAVPSTPSQVLTITRPTVDYTDFNTNIAKLVYNYIESKPSFTTSATLDIIDGFTDEGVWVYYEAVYTDKENDIADITGTFFANNSYTEYADGVNAEIPQSYLTSSVRRKLSRDGVLLVPFINDGTYTSITFQSFPTTELITTKVLTPINNSEEYIQYAFYELSNLTTDNRIRVTFNTGAGTETINYDIIDECRYSPKTVIFKNKFGVYDILTMFTKSVESLNVKKEMFNNNYVTNGTYDIEKHQLQDMDIYATEKIVCNSGIIKDEENELYKEMLLSEKVYFLDGLDLIPVRPTTSNLTYKTRINDSLVEYQIEFMYAYNTINNV